MRPLEDPTTTDPGTEATDDVEVRTGAEGGERSARTGAPFGAHPDDDSPLGDTDQHSRTAEEGTDPGDEQGMRG